MSPTSFSKVEAPEYAAFLQENGLQEADVLPMLRDRSVLSDPQNVMLMAQLFVAMKNANEHEIEQIGRLMDGMSANTNSLIRTIDKDFRSRLRRSNRTLPDDFEIGVFPLNSFNARAVPRGKKSLLLLDTGLIEILEVAVALSLLESPVEHSGERLVKIIADYVSNRRLPDVNDRSHPLWDLEDLPSQKRLYYPIVSAAELFVLLHEYAHHVLGHLASKCPLGAARLTSDVVTNVYSHECEFQADMWALHLLYQAYETEKDRESFVAIACAAPVFFMATCVLVDMLSGMSRNEMTSHPHPCDRMYVLTMMLFHRGWSDRDHCFLWWRYESVADAAYRIVTGNEMPIPRHDPALREYARSFSDHLMTHFS